MPGVTGVRLFYNHVSKNSTKFKAESFNFPSKNDNGEHDEKTHAT